MLTRNSATTRRGTDPGVLIAQTRPYGGRRAINETCDQCRPAVHAVYRAVHGRLAPQPAQLRQKETGSCCTVRSREAAEVL